MKFFNPVLDRKIHEQMAAAILKTVGEEHYKGMVYEDDEEFIQTVITLKPLYAKGKTEYEIIHEISTLFYCSGLFYPTNSPGAPGWHGTNVERLHQLIDGEIGDYLKLVHEKTASERILVDVDIDTSRLESDNIYTIYLTPMTKA